MDKIQAKKRIEKLKEVINRHRYFYHVLDRQEINDSALDSLKRELYQLEQQSPQFITVDSPTQRVGGQPLKEFKKIRHEKPMLSIEDVFSEKELQAWQDYLKRLIPHYFLTESDSGVEYFCELKIDGFAITLIYESGVFIYGATRGDGKIGEDVTQNLKTIESIPLKLRIYNKPFSLEVKEKLEKLIKKGRIEIRGEVYMEKAAFTKFNSKLEKEGQKTFANPRNLAAGSIRQLDPKLAASRPLKFLAYDIVSNVGQKKHSESHLILSALGFKTDSGKVCKNVKEVVDFWQKAVKKREALPFLVDGVVVNVNDNYFFKELGVAGKSPRGVRAFKFSPKQATTKVLDIKIQVGRTGAITPIAALEPIEVGGVIISRATLHNEKEIKRLGVKIGDTVIVERAGDVIPSVAGVLPELRSGGEKEFHFPKICPICCSLLKKPEDEAIWRCLNSNCLARKKEKLYFFVSKKAFYIDGLGPKIIDRLIEKELISRPTDLFELTKEDLICLERFAEKSVENLLKAIEKSKKIPLNRFIFALGIRYVGEETAEKLANYLLSSNRGRKSEFSCLDIVNKLKKIDKEELKKISDVGEKVSESIFNWFNLKSNQKFVEDLLKVGVKMKNTDSFKAIMHEQKLKGKTFVLTGVLNSMTREKAKEKIRSFGGSAVDAVSQKTDYLVIGKEPGSLKLKKAVNFNVKIINERRFFDLFK